MKSSARDVDDYIEEVPVQRNETLVELRELWRSSLKSFKESIQYGRPGYSCKRG